MEGAVTEGVEGVKGEEGEEGRGVEDAGVEGADVE